MKRVIVIIFLLISPLLAKEYAIIAFSSKTLNQKAAYKFLKRFPNGIIKRYSRFIEYKIEPFANYKSAKKFLKRVKRYYKHPLIVKYNPSLGKVIDIKPKRQNSKIGKKRNISYCRNECGCKKEKDYPWEIDIKKSLAQIEIKVKEYLSKNEQKRDDREKISAKEVAQVAPSNQTCKHPSISRHFFYLDIYANIYEGQKYLSKLRGNNENIKLGFIYDRYFWDIWRFYTDDRLIFSRRDINGDISNGIDLDINELYIRSYCLNDDLTNILLGRKKTRDLRSWWYDAPLDQIRLFSENYLLNYEAILATRFNDNVNIDDNDRYYKLKDSFFVILHANYEYRYRNNIGIYYIYENSKPNDEETQKRDISFVGVELYGHKNSLFYWANAGISNGDITRYDSTQKADGYGFDIGAKLSYKDNLSFAFDYAYGSGKDLFTQPYIASNDSDYLSKNLKIKYYGNIIDPALENLQIISLYAIYDLDEKKSIVASLHNYRQNTPTKTNFNDKYFFYTNGKDKEIGNEFDLVYQYLQNKSQKLKIGIGYFAGSKAYEYLEDKDIYRLFLNYRYYWH
ncbi:MAG: alginate export family protein [Epsilonproteobacteria bacterium]|nr:alginate export family protein [Campylobacterota bacterium]